MNWLIRGLISIILLSVILAPLLHAATNPPEADDIAALLREHVDVAKRSPGIVVGIIDANGPRIYSHGHFERDQGREVDGDTTFEIGSITKVFTSLALADMVERGEVKLDDPVSKYLPASVKLPSRNGREITLVDLATHTSGLPPMPDNFTPADPINPYADYTVAQLYVFLGSYTLTRDIGADYEYSNLGAGLLGHILALKAGTNYESLVLQRICQPLGLTNTQITLTPGLRARLAPGHDESGRPAANWDLPTLAGAGALRSTANDLLKFAGANLGLTKTDLQSAMQLTHTPRHAAGAVKIGLGWHIVNQYNHEFICHNGETGGYYSFLGLDQAKKRAVVVLANSAYSVDELGFHLLQSQYEAEARKSATNRVAIQLDPKLFDPCVGEYEFQPGLTLTTQRRGDHYFVKLTGQSFLEIFPESETEYFLKVVDAQLTFEKDSQGVVTTVTLHQNGMDQKARKVP